MTVHREQEEEGRLSGGWWNRAASGWGQFWRPRAHVRPTLSSKRTCTKGSLDSSLCRRLIMRNKQTQENKSRKGRKEKRRQEKKETKRGKRAQKKEKMNRKDVLRKRKRKIEI